MALVLASASPRRRELLAALGVEFEVDPSEVDESSAEPEPSRLAKLLALRKACAVAARRPDDLVLGADTIVVLDGLWLGKPADSDEARSMLKALRARTHEVVTGIAVVANDAELMRSVSTRVTMRDYADLEVARYIERGEPFDKAGGYAIQDADLAPAAAVEGCTCAVIGLPLWTTRDLLRDVGGLECGEPTLVRCEECPERS